MLLRLIPPVALTVPRGVARVRLRIGGLAERSVPVARINPDGLRIALRTGEIQP